MSALTRSLSFQLPYAEAVSGMVAPPVLAVESARGLMPSTCTTGWFASTHTRSFAVSVAISMEPSSKRSVCENV